MTTPTPQTLNRFAPRTRGNPAGYEKRDVTISLDRASRDATDARLSIAFSSEAAVARYDWETDTEYDEILVHTPGTVDLSYAIDGLPFCVDHDLGRMVGLLEDVIIDGDRIGRGMLRRGSHPDAEWALPDMENGIRKKISFGYWPGDNYTQSKTADGRIQRFFVGWCPYEVSTVPVPADYDLAGVGRSAQGAAADRTSIPAAAEPAQPKERTMPEVTSERGVAPALDTRAVELSTIAREAKMTDRLVDWISGNTSVDDAQREVRKVLVERAEAAELRAPTSAPIPVSVTVGQEREADKPWGNDADFFRAVIKAGRGGGVEPRLRAQNTVSGEDGGFAVPQSVVNMLLQATVTDGEILKRVTERPITTGNAYTETLVKEEARTNGSRNGGVRGYWLAEDGTYLESQAATRQLDIKLQKLGALVKLTEEQIEDGPALLSFIQEQVPEELRFVAEQAIWEGDGTAKPLGATVSGALVTVAIEATQTIANTNGFIWKNAANMYSRMLPRNRKNAAWFINDELWANILTATAGTSAGAVPMFIPPGQMQQFPEGAIYGKPVVPIEYASAQGTVGDFVFADFSDYLFATKGGLKTATSMHAEFVRDRQLLKFTWRVNGAPRTRVPLTPFKGSATKSPYLALAVRA